MVTNCLFTKKNKSMAVMALNLLSLLNPCVLLLILLNIFLFNFLVEITFSTCCLSPFFVFFRDLQRLNAVSFCLSTTSFFTFLFRLLFKKYFGNLLLRAFRLSIACASVNICGLDVFHSYFRLHFIPF